MTWVWIVLLLGAWAAIAVALVRQSRTAHEHRARFKSARDARDHWYQTAHRVNKRYHQAAEDRNRAFLSRDRAYARLDQLESDVKVAVDTGDVEGLKKWVSS